MLRQRALIIAIVVLVFASAAVFFGRRSRSPSRTHEGEVERGVEGEGEVEREIEVERERERAIVDAGGASATGPLPIQLGGTEVRLAQIRQEVHLLEMQRLEARERGDHEAEARLDAQIAAARAEHDRIRNPPEGI